MLILAAEGIAYIDVIAISLCVAAAFLLSFQGLWLVCRALWPRNVEASAQHVRKHPFGCFVLGAVISAALFALVRGMAMRRGMPGHVIGYVILFFYVMFAGVGMSGLVTHIGRRLISPADAFRPWLATVRGGLALQLACLLPGFGWFGILGVSIITGVGAAVMAAFSATTPSAQQSPGGATSPKRQPMGDDLEASSVRHEGAV